MIQAPRTGMHPASILVPALLLAALAHGCGGNQTPDPAAPAAPAAADPVPGLRGQPGGAAGSADRNHDTRPTNPEDTPPMTDRTRSDTKAIATFGAGCFWCIEAVLERVDGVFEVESGYMGGTVDDPTYEQVCSGRTGHAEVVQVTFDPARLPYAVLLDWFFRAHDPTTLNRQGPDVGTQYRSAVFYHSEDQRREALAAKERAQAKLEPRIVTEITAATKFWPAEDYHQDYFRNNPDQAYCRALIPPKLEKLGLDK
jgi:peptide-methionine (S)-S-oxide reductase